MRVRFLAVAAAVAAAALTPLAASAGGGSISATVPATLELSAKVLVTVPVSVVCTDVPGVTPVEDEFLVNIEQANRSTVASGSGAVGAAAPNLLLTCDGTTVNTVDVPVLASSSGSPFKNGSAVVTVTAERGYGTSCGPNCIIVNQALTTTVGPQTVALRT